MRKYFHLLNVGIQSTMAYRTNFLFRSVVILVPLLAMISVWRAIYDGKEGMVAGYNLAEMISYCLVVMIADALTAVTEDDWQIAAEIKDGHITQFLTRPMDFLHYRLCLFFSGRLVYTMTAALPVAAFVAWHREYLLPPASAVALAGFAVSLLAAALLQFLLSFLTGLLAFWILEISTFVFILLAFERIASGQMFPLNMLPGSLEKLLWCTPFPYLAYFPVSVYLGKIDLSGALQGLLVQGCWVVALYGAARLIWRRGLRCYTAVGN